MDSTKIWFEPALQIHSYHTHTRVARTSLVAHVATSTIINTYRDHAHSPAVSCCTGPACRITDRIM